MLGAFMLSFSMLGVIFLSVILSTDCYVKCYMLSVRKLRIVMLSVIIPSVIMLWVSLC